MAPVFDLINHDRDRELTQGPTEIPFDLVLDLQLNLGVGNDEGAVEMTAEVLVATTEEAVSVMIHVVVQC